MFNYTWNGATCGFAAGATFGACTSPLVCFTNQVYHSIDRNQTERNQFGHFGHYQSFQKTVDEYTKCEVTWILFASLVGLGFGFAAGSLADGVRQIAKYCEAKSEISMGEGDLKEVLVDLNNDYYSKKIRSSAGKAPSFLDKIDLIFKRLLLGGTKDCRLDVIQKLDECQKKLEVIIEKT